MKNQYFGDINDYIKYSLLRSLSNNGQITTSVCWMLTPDDGKGDGQFTEYLNQPYKWRSFDPELFDFFQERLKNRVDRNVRIIEKSNMLGNTRFFSDQLPDNSTKRKHYFGHFLEFSREVDLVFFDPDNGIEVPSQPFGSKDSCKYLYWRELNETINSGHSVLVYQHFPREKREPFVYQKLAKIREQTGLENVIAFCTSRVVFFLVTQEKHLELFDERRDTIENQWGSQISIVESPQNGIRQSINTTTLTEGESEEPRKLKKDRGYISPERITPGGVRLRIIKPDFERLGNIVIVLSEDLVFDKLEKSWKDIESIVNDFQKRFGTNLNLKGQYSRYDLFYLYESGFSYNEIAKIINYDIYALILIAMDFRDEFIRGEYPAGYVGLPMLYDWYRDLIQEKETFHEWLIQQFENIDNGLYFDISSYPMDRNEVRSKIRYFRGQVDKEAIILNDEPLFPASVYLIQQAGGYQKLSDYLKKFHPEYWEEISPWVEDRYLSIEEEIKKAKEWRDNLGVV